MTSSSSYDYYIIAIIIKYKHLNTTVTDWLIESYWIMLINTTKGLIYVNPIGMVMNINANSDPNLSYFFHLIMAH